MEELNLLIYIAHKFADQDDNRKDAEKTIRKLKNGSHARSHVNTSTHTPRQTVRWLSQTYRR